MLLFAFNSNLIDMNAFHMEYRLSTGHRLTNGHIFIGRLIATWEYGNRYSHINYVL